MKFITTGENQTVKLVMFERTMMPESDRSTDDKGKTIFVKNGKEVEFTTYTFRDTFGDKLVLMSKSADYRPFEGKFVNITLDVTLNDFTKKIQTKLVSCELSEDQDPL